VLKPIRRELSEYKFDGVDKGRLEVTEGEGSQMGVSTNLGTKVNRRKRAVRFDPNIVENVGPKRGDKGDRVVVKVVDTRKEAKEVTCYEFFLWYPEFLTVVVNNGVLMGMAVDGKGAGGSVEEIGKEVGYRYL